MEEELPYLCSLLVQTLPQVSNALVHHRHLGVPLVQQLLVLGQFAALLQVVTIASLKDQRNCEKLIPLKAHAAQQRAGRLSASAAPAALGRASSAPGLQVQREPTPCGPQVGPASRPALLIWVPGRAAGDALFSGPPAAGSAGGQGEQSRKCLAIQSK